MRSLADERNRQQETNIDNERDEDELVESNLEDERNEMTNIENNNPTRPVRTRQPNPKFHDFYQFLLSEEQRLKDITIQEYDYHESELIANILTNLENNVKHQRNCYT